jgi:hypothetical protein
VSADHPQYVAGMDKLTTDQARKIRDALGPAHGYLNRLIDRLQATGLRDRDKHLYALVRAAEEAMHKLSVELHYQSCKSGVGRPPTDGT